jgi:hypothetical protein
MKVPEDLQNLAEIAKFYAQMPWLDKVLPVLALLKYPQARRAAADVFAAAAAKLSGCCHIFNNFGFSK